MVPTPIFQEITGRCAPLKWRNKLRGRLVIRKQGPCGEGHQNPSVRSRVPHRTVHSPWHEGDFGRRSDHLMYYNIEKQYLDVLRLLWKFWRWSIIIKKKYVQIKSEALINSRQLLIWGKTKLHRKEYINLVLYFLSTYSLSKDLMNNNFKRENVLHFIDEVRINQTKSLDCILEEEKDKRSLWKRKLRVKGMEKTFRGWGKTSRLVMATTDRQ